MIFVKEIRDFALLQIVVFHFDSKGDHRLAMTWALLGLTDLRPFTLLVRCSKKLVILSFLTF